MRTVKVGLEADVAGYVAGVDRADKATENFDRDVEKLDHDLNKIPVDAAKAGAALAGMGEAAKRTGNDVDDLGKRTSRSADDTGKLDRRIGELKTSVRDLGTEFDRTGDPSLLKKFRADSAELAGLLRMRKETGGFASDVKDVAGEAEKAAAEVQKLTKGMGLFSFETPGMGQAGAAGVGLLGIPALAGAGGTVAALAGAGAAGLGIYGAVLGDPDRFAKAWGLASGQVEQDLIEASRPFTGPAMDAIRSVPAVVASWHLESALAPAVKYVPELVRGIEGFATGIEHGAADLVAKAGPAVTALSEGMDRLGDATGSALSSIADGAEGGAQALRDTAAALSYVIEGFGGVVEGAEKAYSFVHDHPIASGIGSFGLTVPISLLEQTDNQTKVLTQTELGAKQAAEEAGHAFDAQGDDLTKLGQKLEAASMTMDKFVGGQVTAALNTMMSLDRATLGFNQSLLAVTDSVKANGHSLDEHTAKGAANVSVILSAVQANIQTYQSNIAAKMGAEQAAAAYDAGTAALEKQLRQAHFTQGQIDGLIGKYRAIPDQVNTDIVLHGLETAIQDLNTTLRLINNIHDKNAIINVTTVYHSKGGPVIGEGGTVPLHGGYAEGTDAATPGFHVVGEHGPEIVAFAGGEHVYTAAQTRSMMVSGYGSSGGHIDNRTVTYVINDASDPERVVAAIRRYEQRNGTDWRSSSRR